MAEPYLAQISIVAFNFPPKNWAFCNGQTLPINQNQALFALLGTTYGGNGQTTFALPNLQGRTPMHVGNGFSLGNTGGEATHPLTSGEMPSHTHTFSGASASAASGNPAGNTFAVPSAGVGNAYAPPPANTALAVTQAAGSGQAHDNMQPYLVLNFIIALAGVFPSRN